MWLARTEKTQGRSGPEPTMNRPRTTCAHYKDRVNSHERFYVPTVPPHYLLPHSTAAQVPSQSMLLRHPAPLQVS